MAAKTAMSSVHARAAPSMRKRAQQRQGDGSLVREPKDKDAGKAETERRARPERTGFR
jgi:hypothetical protein